MFNLRKSYSGTFARNNSITKALIISSMLVISSSEFISAAESNPTSPMDSLPQTIRNQLVHATGGATITDVKVDSTHGDTRYVAHYRDSATQEQRTVILGQLGNVIDSGAIPVADTDTAVGGTVGEKPKPVKPDLNDGPVPITPPQRPIAPVIPETPAVAKTNPDAQPDPDKDLTPVVPIPRPSPPISTDQSAKPVGLSQKDEDRDRNKPTSESQRKSENSAPSSEKSPSSKKP